MSAYKRAQDLPRFMVQSFKHRGERRAFYVYDRWDRKTVGSGIHLNKKKAERECEEFNQRRATAKEGGNAND